jgi:CHAT domain-containing protein
MNKRDALRAAQIATAKKIPEPYFWAAFYLTGAAK